MPDENPQQQNSPEAKKVKEELFATTCAWISESLFIILPLLVLTLILHYKDKDADILRSSEWSFAASIFFGLGLTRLVNAYTIRGAKSDPAGCLFTVILVLGLVPSLVVLALVLLSEPPKRWLVVAQLLLCLLGFLNLWVCIWASVTIRLDMREGAK